MVHTEFLFFKDRSAEFQDKTLNSRSIRGVFQGSIEFKYFSRKKSNSRTFQVPCELWFAYIWCRRSWGDQAVSCRACPGRRGWTQPGSPGQTGSPARWEPSSPASDSSSGCVAGHWRTYTSNTVIAEFYWVQLVLYLNREHLVQFHMSTILRKL